MLLNQKLKGRKTFFLKARKFKKQGVIMKKPENLFAKNKRRGQRLPILSGTDIPPMRISDKDIKILSDLIPELPKQKRKRFEIEYKLPNDYIEILIGDTEKADYLKEQ